MSYPPPPGDWGAPQPGPGYPQGGGYDPQQYPGQQPGYGPPPGADPYGQGADPYGQGADPYGQQAPADPYTAPGFGPDPYGQQPPMDGSHPYGQPPMSGPPGPGQGWDGAPPPPPPSKSGPPVWLFVVGAVVLLVVLAGGGIVAFQAFSGGGDDSASGGSDSGESSEPDDSQSSDEEGSGSESGMVIDTGSGLSYPAMESWEQEGASYIPGFATATGQMLETEPGWAANLLVGELDVVTTEYEDLESAPDTVEMITKQLEDEVFNNPETGEPLEGFESAEPESEEFTVDGYDAVLYAYDATWDDSAIDATGERISVGIVDRGDGTAAGFLATLPDNIDDTAREEAITAIDGLSFE